MRLAQRTGRIDASGIRKVFDLARSMRDPINLSIGQPDFDVPDRIKQAAMEAIRDGRNGYTPTQGIAPLRAAIAEEERQYTGRSYPEGGILVTSGVSGGILLALMALVDPGDEVLIPDPYFVMYKHLVRLLGGVPVYLDTYATDFLVEPQALRAAITSRTRLLLLNSPCNPTGRILPADRLEQIAAVCREAAIPVLSDEIYRAFAYEPAPSIAACYEDTLVLAGHSKAFGMTGWRLGYACGPEELVQAMAMIQQYSFVCAPAVSQYAALACPAVDMSGHLADYRRKRDLMVDILSPAFTVAPSDGAFYLWIEAPKGMSGSGFVERAIAANVLIIPGAVFSERDTHFRVCYTVAHDRLEAGARRLVELAG
ncbi:MAG: pyridoxal phosphate-dependent aminotransferase [Planctomycetota bacterium]